MRTSDSIANISVALMQFQGQITQPTKNKQANTGKFSYEYADLNSLLAHCRDAMLANGLVFCSAGLTSRIAHVSGEWIEGELAFELTGLTPQQIGSCVSYSRRYLFQGLLGLNAESDHDAADFSTTPPAAPPRAAAPAKAPATPPKRVETPKSLAREPILIVEKLPPGVSKLHPEKALPEGWGPEPGADPGEETDWSLAEPIRMTGYAQPKTLVNGAIKMGIKVIFADGTDGWADSWDIQQHKGLQDAILTAKRAKQDGLDILAILEREPKRDGNGDWVKLKEWKVA